VAGVVTSKEWARQPKKVHSDSSMGEPMDRHGLCCRAVTRGGNLAAERRPEQATRAKPVRYGLGRNPLARRPG
jgi:hypothetical protein